MINVIENNTLINHIGEYNVILVGTNCYQSMRNGFQFEIADKFPYVKEMNNNTKYGDIDKLGTILECKNENNPIIILLFISFGYNFKGNNNEYIDYNALEKCLKLINLLYKGKKIASTLIGSTFYDGNGDKDKIMGIINKTMNKVDFDIYTYEQSSHQILKKNKYLNFKERKYAKENNIN